MSALFMFGVIFIAVVAMIIAISKFNIHPFIVMVVIAIAMGLVSRLRWGSSAASTRLR